MASYFARVELHAADSDDYDVLHESMQNRGFGRTIKGNDSVTYQLPTGTYVGGANYNSLQDALVRPR